MSNFGLLFTLGETSKFVNKVENSQMSETSLNLNTKKIAAIYLSLQIDEKSGKREEKEAGTQGRFESGSYIHIASIS